MCDGEMCLEDIIATSVASKYGNQWLAKDFRKGGRHKLIIIPPQHSVVNMRMAENAIHNKVMKAAGVRGAL